MTSKLDLKIAEARIDEFQTWFREYHPLPATADVVSFDPEPGSAGIIYNVTVKGMPAKAAEMTEAAWRYAPSVSDERDSRTGEG